MMMTTTPPSSYYGGTNQWNERASWRARRRCYFILRNS
jgi:hypothetical protein